MAINLNGMFWAPAPTAAAPLFLFRCARMRADCSPRPLCAGQSAHRQSAAPWRSVAEKKIHRIGTIERGIDLAVVDQCEWRKVPAVRQASMARSRMQNISLTTQAIYVVLSVK